MTLRHALNWKTLFYECLLPVLRHLGPGPADAVLAALGRLAGAWPWRARARWAALDEARAELGADWDVAATTTALAKNLGRFAARDYLLDGLSDRQLAERFDVQGEEHLHEALAAGRGVVLVGSHLGAYLAGVHWLHRQNIPLRLLVQRPQHVSRSLQECFDRPHPEHPQSTFFLRRDLPKLEASRRILRAHAALRDGFAVYLSGDIPWTSPNARPGRLLGRERSFLGVWADMAVLARAPVVPLFCTHLARGRYRLVFEPPWSLAPGDEATAVACYLARLDAEIAAQPAEAVAHLTWPRYRAEPGPQGSRSFHIYSRVPLG
jgi:lauroyl/myristoyl acyltransferase